MPQKCLLKCFVVFKRKPYLVISFCSQEWCQHVNYIVFFKIIIIIIIKRENKLLGETPEMLLFV